MATIDFTSAYRDATQGSTLKALAARRAEMQAANAAMKPREVKSPWQGAANIADTISGAIREGRIANDEAKGRARFAELLAGGLAPDEIGEAMGLDPETTMKYQERTWAQEDTKATRDYESGRDDTKHGWDVTAASDRVKAEQEAARVAAEDARKQAAQKVIDDIETAKQKAPIEQETTRLSQENAAEIDSKKAMQDAATSDPVAKVKLAMQTLGPDGKPLMSAEEGNAEIAAIQIKKRMESQSPASKQFDLDSAKDNQDWVSNGRVQNITNMTMLDKALADLGEYNATSASGAVIPKLTGIGAPSGVVTSTLPDWANRLLSRGLGVKDSIDTRDNVRTVAQQSLKAVLGPQFTEREGTGIMDRAFAPGATPEENVRRVKLLGAKLQEVAKYNDQRAEWLANNPTMEGFAGPTPAEVQADFLAYMNSPDFTGDGGGGGGGTEAPPSEDDIQETMRANNMTREQVMDALAKQKAGGR